MPLLHVPGSVISSNARVKTYPLSCVVQVANSYIFREPGYEPETRPYAVSGKGKSKNPERSRQSSMFRARARVRDLALCNNFTHFFTWTLDAKMIDRYDTAAVKKRTEDFLKNMVRRKNFSYVCIPERHKDGAIHFHGLCCIGELKLVRATQPSSGVPLSTNHGQPIFNMDDWKLGFSTCIPIDENYERTCNYLIKYITKDTDMIFGKWYWSSRNLVKRPETQLLECVNFDSFVEDNPTAHTFPVFKDIKMCCLQIPLEVPHDVR